MTILPNLIAAGIVTVVLGLVIIVWSIGLVLRKYDGTVLILLSVYVGYARDAVAE